MISAQEARNLLASNSEIKEKLKMIEEAIKDAAKQGKTSVEILSASTNDYIIHKLKVEGFSLQFVSYDTYVATKIIW